MIKKVLSKQAQILLLKTANSNRKRIIYINNKNRVGITIGNKQFIDRNNVNSVIKWKQALKELIKNKLIMFKTTSDTVLRLTKNGYKTVKNLTKNYKITRDYKMEKAG